MKRELKEAEKNYLVCAGLMIIVGISMLLIGKSSWGICSVLIGILFAGVAIKSIVTTEGPKRTKETKVVISDADANNKIIEKGEIETK